MKKWASGILILILCVSVSLFLFGCGTKEATGDIIEEPEITVDYLSGEFADQLIRDGAEEHLGSIAISKGKNNAYNLSLNDKSIVKSDDYEAGYYIADKNTSGKWPLGSEARITYIDDSTKNPKILNVDQFVKKVENDENAGETKLYKVYIISDNVELVLAEKLK
ncbi:MAG: hypothetical protein RSD88_06660 [Anaerovoracaceae bacterium]